MPVATHLTAWYESVDQTLAPITPVAATGGETVHTVSGDDLKPHPQLANIVAAYVGSASIERARFSSASLQASGALPYLAPLSGSEEPGVPTVFHDLRMAPIAISADENLQLQVENDGAASAEDVVGLVWMGAAPSQAQGAWRTIRATTTASAMTAHQWNTRAVSLDDDLPAGTYEIGGVTAIGTSLIAGRTVQKDSIYKPGFLCYDTIQDANAMTFRHGKFGTYGTFKHDQPLDIEFFPDAADNESQEIYLDIRKVS